MRCATCDMRIRGNGIVEVVNGRLYYFCCEGCRDLSVCEKVKISEKLKRKLNNEI